MPAQTLSRISLSVMMAVAGSSVVFAQELVTVDGSSTVFPISEAMAEEFQKETGDRVTVGLSGTGGGFKKFCRGETDVTGASRPIKVGAFASSLGNLLGAWPAAASSWPPCAPPGPRHQRTVDRRGAGVHASRCETGGSQSESCADTGGTS